MEPSVAWNRDEEINEPKVAWNDDEEMNERTVASHDERMVDRVQANQRRVYGFGVIQRRTLVSINRAYRFLPGSWNGWTRWKELGLLFLQDIAHDVSHNIFDKRSELFALWTAK
jgi:hypothetical protein